MRSPIHEKQVANKTQTYLLLQLGVNLFAQEIVMREICEAYLADIRGINEDVTQEQFAKLFTSFSDRKALIRAKLVFV